MNAAPLPLSEPWSLDPERLQVLRIVVPALLAIAIAYAFAPVLPTMLAVSVIVAAGAAWSASRRVSSAPWTAAARDALLAVSAFTYPVFLGGRGLSVFMAVLTITILAIRWLGSTRITDNGLRISGSDTRDPISVLRDPRTTDNGLRISGNDTLYPISVIRDPSPLATAQTLTIALGTGLGVAAVQFLLSVAWWWTTIGVAITVAIATVLVLRTQTVAITQSAIIALAMAEAILVIRALPTHWAMNGIMLAFAFAAASNRIRAFHWTYLTLLLITLLVGGVLAR